MKLTGDDLYYATFALRDELRQSRQLLAECREHLSAETIADWEQRIADSEARIARLNAAAIEAFREESACK